MRAAGGKHCELCGCPQVKWLRVITVARQFGCSPRKIRRLLASGELEGLRLGREWRVNHESLDELVERYSLHGGLPPEGPQ